MDMKKLRHKVKINVSDGSQEKQNIMTNTSLRLPRRLIKLLFGDLADVMVVTAGPSIESIEIKELGEEDDHEIV